MNTMRVRSGGGEIAVSVAGAGLLVLCIPGMGEAQGSFRHLVPELVAAGFRVATMDLRGHGDSDIAFDSYDDEAAASDALAVVEALKVESAVLIGNSMGAAAAVIAAARQPEWVHGAVLIGPFVRNHGSVATRLLLRLMLMRPWGRAVWGSYYASLFGKNRPSDHDAHVARTRELLRRPGRWPVFQKTAQTSHAPAEAVLAAVAQPVLVVMGSADPDFPNSQAEAQWVAEAVRGNYRMIDGAGHYPMGEQPEETAAVIASFLKEVSRG